MKIAQLSRECSRNGGVGNYVLGLCHALAGAGHEVAVIHADYNGELANSDHISQFHVKDFDLFGSESDCRRRADRVMECLSTIQPDAVLIQSNNNFSLEYEVRRHFPAIKFLHVYDFCPSGNKFHHLTGAVCHHPTSSLCLLRMGYKRCMLSKRPQVLWQHFQRCGESNRNNLEYDRLIVASDYVKQQAVASGYSDAGIDVLPYFTNIPDSVRAPDQANTILFIGRIEREKGLNALLQVASLMNENERWRLVVAGDGTDLKRVKRRCHRLGLSARTDFLGWVDARQRSELYRAASAVVVPSVWPEPFGIVGIEAMSHARPVVAFRLGGIPEWLEDGVSGFAIPPYNVREMANRLMYLLQHPDMSYAMGMRGRQIAERRFNADRHVARLVGILQGVIDGRACAAASAG